MAAVVVMNALGPLSRQVFSLLLLLEYIIDPRQQKQQEQQEEKGYRERWRMVNCYHRV